MFQINLGLAYYMELYKKTKNKKYVGKVRKLSKRWTTAPRME